MTETKVFAVVLEKTDVVHVYSVLTSLGDTVEAYDIAFVGFRPGSHARIIQVGDRYGIMRASSTLPGVLQVRQTAVAALAEEYPAAFAAAYIGYQLGRLVRLYASAITKEVSAAAVKIEYTEGEKKGKEEILKCAPGSGLVPRNFLVDDSVVVALRPSIGLAGWWHRSALPDSECILGLGIVAFLLCDDDGEYLVEEDPAFLPSVTMEYGRYIEVSPEEWIYDPLGASGVDDGYHIDDEDPTSPIGAVVPAIVYFPNAFRLTYTHRGTTYTADIAANATFDARGAVGAIIDTDGSVAAQVTAPVPEEEVIYEQLFADLEDPQENVLILGDTFIAYGTANFEGAAGFVDPPPDETLGFSTTVSSGSLADMQSGIWDSAGDAVADGEPVSWRARGKLKTRRPSPGNSSVAASAQTTAGGEGVQFLADGDCSLYFLGEIVVSRKYKATVMI